MLLLTIFTETILSVVSKINFKIGIVFYVPFIYLFFLIKVLSSWQTGNQKDLHTGWEAEMGTQPQRWLLPWGEMCLSLRYVYLLSL